MPRSLGLSEEDKQLPYPSKAHSNATLRFSDRLGRRWRSREGRGWCWSAGNGEAEIRERLRMKRLRGESGNREAKRGEVETKEVEKGETGNEGAERGEATDGQAKRGEGERLVLVCW